MLADSCTLIKCCGNKATQRKGNYPSCYRGDSRFAEETPTTQFYKLTDWGARGNESPSQNSTTYESKRTVSRTFQIDRLIGCRMKWVVMVVCCWSFCWGGQFERFLRRCIPLHKTKHKTVEIDSAVSLQFVSKLSFKTPRNSERQMVFHTFGYVLLPWTRTLSFLFFSFCCTISFHWSTTVNGIII